MLPIVGRSCEFGQKYAVYTNKVYATEHHRRVMSPFIERSYENFEKKSADFCIISFSQTKFTQTIQ